MLIVAAWAEDPFLVGRRGAWEPSPLGDRHGRCPHGRDPSGRGRAGGPRAGQDPAGSSGTWATSRALAPCHPGVDDLLEAGRHLVLAHPFPPFRGNGGHGGIDVPY